jgi:hypothetical protein
MKRAVLGNWPHPSAIERFTITQDEANHSQPNQKTALSGIKKQAEN